jgi:hypothetical protein
MYRNPKLLKLMRELPCSICQIDDGTVVGAHSNQLRDGKGRGLKSHDYRVAALCYNCHMSIDQSNKLDKQEKIDLWEMAHRRTIAYLFENNLIEVK